MGQITIHLDAEYEEKARDQKFGWKSERTSGVRVCNLSGYASLTRPTATKVT